MNVGSIVNTQENISRAKTIFTFSYLRLVAIAIVIFFVRDGKNLQCAASILLFI